jgi:hypothetical protein
MGEPAIDPLQEQVMRRDQHKRPKNIISCFLREHMDEPGDRIEIRADLMCIISLK